MPDGSGRRGRGRRGSPTQRGAETRGDSRVHSFLCVYPPAELKLVSLLCRTLKSLMRFKEGGLRRRRWWRGGLGLTRWEHLGGVRGVRPGEDAARAYGRRYALVTGAAAAAATCCRAVVSSRDSGRRVDEEEKARREMSPG